MKTATFVTAIAAFGLLVSGSKLSYAQAEAICGDLGVMEVTDLPDGVDPNAVRTCKEHPEGATPNSLDKRDCWYGDSPGCSKNGYCYKSCAQQGSGFWCWTALNNGFGDWKRCNSAGDCSNGDQCGAGNDCKACGCSC